MSRGGRAALLDGGGLTPLAALLSIPHTNLWLPFPQYLFEEEDGTGAVTDNDAVGYVTDLSGNGFHLVQATAGNRPLYQTDGTLHWLESDGVDDYLSVTYEGNRAHPTERISAFQRLSNVAGVNDLLIISPAGNCQLDLVDAGATESLRIANSSGSLQIDGLTDPYLDAFVATERHSGGADSRLAIDDGAYTTGNTGVNSGNGFILFSASGVNPSNAKWFGTIEKAGIAELWTDAQIARARKAFATLQGRML
jgi:hypothetical protein